MSLLTTLVLAACAFTPMPPAKDPAPEMKTQTAEEFSKQYRAITTGIGKARAVKLWEGLPHQFYEEESLAKELKTKKHVQLHGYPFYEPAIALGEKDAKQLRELCGDLKSFKQREGLPKPCGGFHPDWCVEFTVEKETYRVLVCIHCHESRLFGPKLEADTDIKDEAYEQLKRVLPPHQKQRPKFMPKADPLGDPFGAP